MMFAKFDVSGAQSVGEVELYLRAVDAQIEFSSTFEVEADFVKVFIETQRDMKTFLKRVIEDYETLGYEIEQDVMLGMVTVFVSDPELNSFFINERLNIQAAASIALSEIIVEVDTANANLEDRVERIETAATLNGTYKMRAILRVIVDALDEKGIFLGDKINAVSMQTVH